MCRRNKTSHWNSLKISVLWLRRTNVSRRIAHLWKIYCCHEFQFSLGLIGIWVLFEHPTPSCSVPILAALSNRTEEQLKRAAHPLTGRESQRASLWSYSSDVKRASESIQMPILPYKPVTWCNITVNPQWNHFKCKKKNLCLCTMELPMQRIFFIECFILLTILKIESLLFSYSECSYLFLCRRFVNTASLTRSASENILALHPRKQQAFSPQLSITKSNSTWCVEQRDFKLKAAECTPPLWLMKSLRVISGLHVDEGAHPSESMQLDPNTVPHEADVCCQWL